jgi:hypothetical protein
VTEQEWDAFTLELAQSFRGTFGQQHGDDANGRAQEVVYRSHFAAVDYDVMVAAVALLVQDGQVFVPAPGELMPAVRRVLQRTRAPFAEVLRGVLALTGEYRPVPPPYPGRAWGPGERAAAARAAEVDAHRRLVAAVSDRYGEAAARWVDARGAAELRGEELDGEYAGAVRHRLEQELAEFTAQAEEDGKVGLALARAQRAAGAIGSGQERRGLRRVSMGEITAGGADAVPDARR